MIKAWSYSRWSTFEQCPYKAKLLYIDGHNEPSNSAMERGSKIHKHIENYLTYGVDTLHKDVVECRDELEELKTKRPICEGDWAFRADWSSCGWFDKDVWCRVKTDAHYIAGDTLHIYDHKTGQKRPAHKDQISIYALGGFMQFPEVQKVVVHYFYVDSGDIAKEEFIRKDDLEKIKFEWNTNGTTMCNTTTFAKKPSKLCGWCVFNKNKRGLCDYA